jgi:MoaA/NifB/PqqE/SkfB family radical SAM enzyme
MTEIQAPDPERIEWKPRDSYSVHWDITKSCNYSCRHCAADDQCLTESSELSLDEIRKVIDNLKTARPVMFSFFGGEPLLRKDILEIIDLIQEKLPNNSIAITTNGSLLQKYGRELLKRNIALAVSLDGISPEVNDKVRGAGTFRQITRNLAYLVAQKKELKDSKARISIAYTITNYSEEPEDILRFCENAGVDSLVISGITEQGSATKNKDLLVDNQKLIAYIERVYLAMKNTKLDVDANLTHPLFVKYFNAKYGADLPYQYAGCRAISNNFYIRPNGVFTACLAAYPDGEAFKKLGLWEPSLIDHRLEDILQDESFQQLSKLKNPGSYPHYTPCNECGFAGSYCDPCWIDCYLDRETNHSMCSLVGAMLDDMHVEWRARYS